MATRGPRGRPPRPSAMSSPSDPDDIVSISIERSFLPSFITEPLPNWRSIWDSAAERALDLSMEDPSTIRRAVADIGRCSLWRGFASGGKGRWGRGGKKHYHDCCLFAICSFFFSAGWVGVSCAFLLL